MSLLHTVPERMPLIEEADAYLLYGPWLLEGERIQTAMRMVRDGCCVTDTRIILMDHLGPVDGPTRVTSIPLNTLVRVTAETMEAGDSQLTVTYVSTPQLSAPSLDYESYTFRFPAAFDVAALYRRFQAAATQNLARLNAA